MADTKISALTSATTPLAGTEVLPIVQSSTTVKVSVANLTAGRAVSASSLTLTGLTASSAVATDASKNLVSVTNTGTGSNVLATAPTLVSDVSLSTGNLSFATTGKGITTSSSIPLGFGTNTSTSQMTLSTAGLLTTTGGASFQGAVNITDANGLNVGSGNVLLNGNANPAVGIAMISTSTAPNIRMSHASGTASGAAYMEFNYDASGCGNITQLGSSAVLFTSISDYRAKTNQAPLSGSGAFIDALKPKTWDWASGDGKGTGFIAHEFQEVSPSSVNGVKDAVDEDGKPVYQSMQASSAEVIANLVAEIQDLRKRLAAAGI